MRTTRESGETLSARPTAAPAWVSRSSIVLLPAVMPRRRMSSLKDVSVSCCAIFGSLTKVPLLSRLSGGIASPTCSWSINSKTRCLVITCLLMAPMEAQPPGRGQDHYPAISGGNHPLDMRIGLCQSLGRGWWSKPIGEARVAPHAPGGDMKARLLVVAVLAAMLAVAATTASGGTSKVQAGKIVVWLQNDAQNGWPEAVALANRNFKAQHPDVDVDVQYQSWGNHLQKFDAGLAGGDAPDVIELGNTEMTKYMAAGAFKALTQSAFPNNKTWLQGLKGSCQYNGKLYGVPYYAGARAVIYRKDQYSKAGIKSTPKSLAQFIAK